MAEPWLVSLYQLIRSSNLNSLSLKTNRKCFSFVSFSSKKEEKSAPPLDSSSLSSFFFSYSYSSFTSSNGIFCVFSVKEITKWQKFLLFILIMKYYGCPHSLLVFFVWQEDETSEKRKKFPKRGLLHSALLPHHHLSFSHPQVVMEAEEAATACCCFFWGCYYYYCAIEAAASFRLSLV